MKKLLLASVAFGMSVAAGSAFAADMSYPVKAPVVVAPAFTWTGFYIGANVGYGWGEIGDSSQWQKYLDWYYDYDCECEVSSAAVSDYYGYYYYDYGFNGASKPEPEGWFGGAQIGYNYQFSNNVVLGVEADVQFADMKDTTSYWADEYFVPYWDAEAASASLDGYGYPTGYSEYGTIQTKIETFGTVRARLGYAFDRFLPYVTGGLAWGNVKVNETYSGYWDGVFDFSESYSASDTLWGWTVGGGIEYALTDNWTVKVEYLYADLGSIDYNPNFTAYANFLGDFDVTLQTVKFGVNYKFSSY